MLFNKTRSFFYLLSIFKRIFLSLFDKRHQDLECNSIQNLIEFKIKRFISCNFMLFYIININQSKIK